MRLTLAVLDEDGATMHHDSWHVPNDLAASGRLWQSAVHSLPAVPARSECRWWIEPCACIACTIPAEAGPAPGFAVQGRLTGPPRR